MTIDWRSWLSELYSCSLFYYRKDGLSCELQDVWNDGYICSCEEITCT